ncbi:MAG: hypothetical protein KDB84_07675 [Flavobacteriales bacterium]|nr:hypothetical protein [Flavobacteriales bacterium]
MMITRVLMMTLGAMSFLPVLAQVNSVSKASPVTEVAGTVHREAEAIPITNVAAITALQVEKQAVPSGLGPVNSNMTTVEVEMEAIAIRPGTPIPAAEHIAIGPTGPAPAQNEVIVPAVEVQPVPRRVMPTPLRTP